MSMYGAIDDPYCYPGTTVLKNKLGLTKQADLDEFEAEISLQRSAEPLPEGKLSYFHYRAIHRHLFQDVYAWAGKPRTVFPRAAARSVIPRASIARRRNCSSNWPRRSITKG